MVRGCAVLLAFGWASSVCAQENANDRTVDAQSDADARQIHEAGVVAFEAGSYEAAMRLFERAYELSERPELLYNIGTTADRLRENEKALDAFQRYLDQVPQAANRAAVERRVEVLQQSLAREQALQAAAARGGGIPGDDTTHNAAILEAANDPNLGADDEGGPKVGLIVGIVVAAVAVVAGAVVLGVLLSGSSGDVQEPDHDFRIQTLHMF